MAGSGHRRSDKSGLPPGSLVYVGEERTETVRISIIDYDAENLTERKVASPAKCHEFLAAPTITWVNVDGIHDTSIISKLGERFGLHPLVLEDIASTGQRAKAEDYDDHIYFVTNMLMADDKTADLQAEQVSLILSKGCLITFQERPGDVFEPVRRRIRNKKGRVREQGADFLLYALLDAIADGYFAALERIEGRIDDVEEALAAEEAGPQTLRQIQAIKRDLIFMRRAVWPLRDAVMSLDRNRSPLISEPMGLFLRDLVDHITRVLESIESMRDLAGDMLGTYLSISSNRMNDVMRVLTVIATIFIPLTFIAGVYGMNFRHMPELQWEWSYPAVWAMMGATALGMLGFFRWKKWL